PPDVMRDTWLELLAIGRDLALVDPATPPDAPFDSRIYRTLYDHLLRARHTRIIEVTIVLPTDAMSVYDYPPTCEVILPRGDEVERWIRSAEAQFGAN